MNEITALEKTSFEYEELLLCGEGKIFGPGNARLPAPPLLMIDRITHLSTTGGAYNKGQIEAQLDINPNLWFFDCHFQGDPVMPGCLGLDALWQLIGFYLGWLGHPGRGRALGATEVKFSGQVTPQSRLVEYRLDVKRVMSTRLVVGIADGTVLSDGEPIYTGSNLRVGLFSGSQL